MEAKSQALADTNALDELIERHTLNLLEILGRHHTIEDLGEEIAVLTDLIHSFKRRDKMIEQLLDNSLSKDKRCQIKVSLEAQHVKIEGSREEMLRLHEKSQLLIQKSAALLAKAQLQINKEAHNHTGYVLKICGLCRGVGKNSDGRCPACKGTGTALARQPANE